MKKDPGKKTGKGGAREGSGRKAVSDRYVFKLAEAWKNGKGYGKAHHSGTENESYPVNTGNTRL